VGEAISPSFILANINVRLSAVKNPSPTHGFDYLVIDFKHGMSLIFTNNVGTDLEPWAENFPLIP
jgi:hypothetical protein